jgi:hypothetical protein
MSMDKHVSHMMLSHGRGSWVIAEATLTENAVNLGANVAQGAVC